MRARGRGNVQDPDRHATGLFRSTLGLQAIDWRS